MAAFCMRSTMVRLLFVNVEPGRVGDYVRVFWLKAV